MYLTIISGSVRDTEYPLFYSFSSLINPLSLNNDKDFFTLLRQSFFCLKNPLAYAFNCLLTHPE